MKRKQANNSNKSPKQARIAKKVVPPKVTEVVLDESEEEVVVPVKRVATAKNLPNRPTKAIKVEEPEPEDVELEEVEEEEQVVDENDDVCIGFKKIFLVDGDDDEEDEAVEEEEDDEDDEEENDGDGDDGPADEAMGSEEPTIPSKVKSGPIPPSVEVTKIVHIKKLPKKCKQIHIVQVFAKYGAIDQIHIVTTPVGTSAKIAYKTEKAALAALSDDNQVIILDCPVTVSMTNEKNKAEATRGRCVYVKNIKNGTTKEQITEHFQSCGKIDSVKVVNRSPFAFAYVNFIDKLSIPIALKLHNSILNDSNIKVNENTGEYKRPHTLDTRRTVVVRNKQCFDSIEVPKLEAIFSKCGEIEDIEVVCRRSVLAFITFKNEDAVAKALEISGTIQLDIELEVEIYSATKKWTTIHVSNLPKDCTEEEVTKHFSNAGEVVNVVVKKSYAIVRFTDSDGYCKSFLYNESYIKGHMIFVEPHSQRKHLVLKKGGSRPKGYKRTFENGINLFKPKTPKME